MKWLWIFLMSSCAQTSEIKVNLYANKVMDIELPTKNIIPYCSIPGDPEKKNSWLGVYIFYNNRVELLSEKRQRLPKKCEKERKFLAALLKKAQRARVIGIERSTYRGDDGLAVILKDPSIKSVDAHWTFSRVITEKGCYGWEGCDEPKLVEKDIYTNIYE